eukprot:284603-Pelagomonas_calceolata.AAC.5
MSMGSEIMVTMGDDLQPGCLADRLVAGTSNLLNLLRQIKKKIPRQGYIGLTSVECKRSSKPSLVRSKLIVVSPGIKGLQWWPTARDSG